MEHGLGIVYGWYGPISLSAVFSSLVSSMGTTDVAGRDDGEMRSDGVHGLLKTTGMTTAPQFQLQRTSRGWVRRKKKLPLIQIGELEGAHRNVVWSKTEDVCNHSVPLSTGAGILPHRQNRKLKELRQGFGRYKAWRNCGCERGNSADARLARGPTGRTRWN